MNKIFEHLKSDWYKYVLELIVITAGILGAFALNNWNENRKAAEQETQVLIAITSELENNLVVLDAAMDRLDLFIQYGDSIRSYLGPYQANIEHDTLHFWIGKIGLAYRTRLKTSVIGELENSGRLSIIRDEEIVEQINEWSSSYDDLVKEEDEWAREFTNNFIPYTSEWISWDQVDYIGEIDGTQIESKFDNDPTKMLQDFKFSNMLNSHYWRINRYDSRLNVLKDQTIELRDLINNKS